jgi:hypothetical protein
MCSLKLVEAARRHTCYDSCNCYWACLPFIYHSELSWRLLLDSHSYSFYITSIKAACQHGPCTNVLKALRLCIMHKIIKSFFEFVAHRHFSLTLYMGSMSASNINEYSLLISSQRETAVMAHTYTYIILCVRIK